VLFTDRTTAARAAATGPDAVPPGTRHTPDPSEAPHSAAPGVAAEAGGGAAGSTVIAAGGLAAGEGPGSAKGSAAHGGAANGTSRPIRSADAVNPTTAE
jgi:hypothetical protein